jgi:hypothetical protein
MQQALHDMEMQGNSNDEELDVGLQEAPVPATVREHQALPQEQPPPDVLMNITAAADTGTPSESTISLLLSINGAKALALANMGSTNTILDHKFAVKHNIAMQPAKARTIKVAGGGTLVSDAIAPNCSFSIAGQQFTANFKIIQLQGSDIILGVNWFKLYNPVTFDFLDSSLTISKDATTFKDQLLLAQHLLITAEECTKLLQQ